MAQGLYLTEPNNLFTLQNDVTKNLNVFEETKERYLRCSDPVIASQVTPVCSNKDTFSNVTVAYQNVYDSIANLENAMQARGQHNPNAITPDGFRQNMQLIKDNYTKIRAVRTQLDIQLQELQKNMLNSDEPNLQLRSSQFIYLLSVIAVICLIYYAVTMG